MRRPPAAAAALLAWAVVPMPLTAISATTASASADIPLDYSVNASTTLATATFQPAPVGPVSGQVTFSGKISPTGTSSFSGTCTIPPLHRCGVATPALNLLVPGPGNTFDASFSPAS